MSLESRLQLFLMENEDKTNFHTSLLKFIKEEKQLTIKNEKQKVEKGLEAWCKKAENQGWIKCDEGDLDNSWHDWGELYSSIYWHIYYFKNILKDKKH